MLNRLCAPVLLACASVMFATPAASRSCGERAKIVERLQSGYGETRAGAGLSPDNGIIEIFSSSETGSWTILITRPDGRSCLVAAGDNWESGPGLVTRSGQPT